MANKTKPVDGYKKTICEKINKYLEETGMSNKEFGDKFGVTEGNVRSWRACKTALDINQVAILMDLWNVSFEELTGYTKPTK